MLSKIELDAQYIPRELLGSISIYGRTCQPSSHVNPVASLAFVKPGSLAPALQIHDGEGEDEKCMVCEAGARHRAFRRSTQTRFIGWWPESFATRIAADGLPKTLPIYSAVCSMFHIFK